MTLRVDTLSLPAGISHGMNGRLFPNQLAQVYLPGHGMGALHPLAKQAFDCMFLIANTQRGLLIDGQYGPSLMTATSLADCYRDFHRQETVFFQRMTTDYSETTCAKPIVTRSYQGRTWYLKKGFAMVATPGESNHGYGLAMDCAVWFQYSPGKFKIAPIAGWKPLWNWIISPEGASSFGLSWESQSETWHLRYNPGNAIPQRIVDIMNFIHAPLVTQ